MVKFLIVIFVIAISAACSSDKPESVDEDVSFSDEAVSDVMNDENYEDADDTEETYDEKLSDDEMTDDETADNGADETNEELSDDDYYDADEDVADEMPEDLPDADAYNEPEMMVTVPAGEFHMGCNEEADTQCFSNEYPYHTVILSEFKIDKYEVTAGQYQDCVDAGLCNNNNSSKPHFSTVTENSACNLGADGKEDYPMNCVTRHGAQAYCEWAGKALPTEAQWEKAARGTDGRKYPWGNEPQVNCDYAVMASKDSSTGEPDACSADGTMPVGSLAAGISPYGAYDMIGNVDEWVSDNYGESYYETSPSENPTGPETGDLGILRGGSWWYTGLDNALRASVRKYYNPDYGNQVSGFRCVE